MQEFLLDIQGYAGSLEISKKKKLMEKAVSLLLQAETNQGYSYGITLQC